MKVETLVRTLTETPQVLKALSAGLTEEELRTPPDAGGWSILDILDHLYLEEQEDFRPRMLSVLEDPTQPWDPLDTVASLRTRQATPHSAAETLEAFARERASSVEILASLRGADWDAAYEHPQIGTLHAGDLVAAWAAHDELHLRQLVQRRFQRVERETRPYSTAYAGAWPGEG